MPVYGASPASLEAGRSSAVWDDENIDLSTPLKATSLSIGLQRNENLPNCFSVELAFAADPGAFAVDIQVSDTDQDKYYVTKATLNVGLNEWFVGRIEATNVVAKFARLRMVTLTNPVKVTARMF